MGKPSTYTQELANEICKQIMEGKSLRQICLEESMPHRSTVHDWLSKDEAFADQYARAKDTQADTLADDIVAISDEAKDRDSAAVAKVRVDARKWVASKLKPKKYGDKLDLEAKVDGNLTIQTVDFSSADNNDSV